MGIANTVGEHCPVSYSLQWCRHYYQWVVLCLQAVVARGEQLVLAEHFAKPDVRERCRQLQDLWKDLNTSSATR